MTKTLLMITSLIALALPLASHAVPVTDPGLGGPPNEPDTARANGPDLGGQGDVADDFVLTLGQQLERVTFWAYLQDGAIWQNNRLDYRIALDDGGQPSALPYTDSSGKTAAGAVNARQDALASGIDKGPFFINNQADYYLNQYSFDLGGIGLEPNVQYWLVLNGSDVIPGPIPNVTGLLWAYNAQNLGSAQIFVPSVGLWVPAAGGVAFDFRAPNPPTLALIAVGLLGVRMLSRAPRARSRSA